MKLINILYLNLIIRILILNYRYSRFLSSFILSVIGEIPQSVIVLKNNKNKTWRYNLSYIYLLNIIYIYIYIYIFFFFFFF